MTEPTTDLLRRAVVDEPPLRLDLGRVTAGGARLRRRQRAARGVGALATVALVGAGALWFPWNAPAGPVVSSAASSGAASLAGSTDAGATTRSTTSALTRTVEGASPAGLSFVWASGSTAANAQGTVDDGAGAAGVSVGLSTSTQQVHPCGDAEFAAGATCTERTLASGAVLSRRGLATGDAGVRSIAVVLTYPDGSGVNAEADNAELTEPVCTSAGRPAGCDAPDAVTTVKPALHAVRTSPVLTLAELVDIVLAVDAARP